MIAVRDMAYVRYSAPDLDLMERFLLDFGLHRAARSDDVLYMRAQGSAAYVHITQRGPARSIGFGLLAASADDLRTLAAGCGTTVQPLDAPGGGLCVTLTDPGGLQVDVVHGIAPVPARPGRAAMAIDPARGRSNQPVRLTNAPSQVQRIGHVAILVPDFAAAYCFYTERLGMRLSDGYTAGPGGPDIGAFLHCGLGSEWVDHHTVAVIAPPGLPAGAGRIDHSAFEVTDLDDVMHGGAHLLAAGWKRSWGVGRHLEGSQIFDYWRDPFGHKIEHWTDGDRVNDDYPSQRSPMDGRLAQWAPPLTPEFFE